MRLILTAVVALTWLFAGQAYADAASARLSDLLGKAETLSGRFSQLTLDASGTHLQEATGQMELKRPGLFRCTPMRRWSSCWSATASRSGCMTRIWSR